jgi:hypothetical protein
MNDRPEVSNGTLLQMIRTRLAVGSLPSVEGKSSAGKGTGQLLHRLRNADLRN